jgi:hypothetical protein
VQFRLADMAVLQPHLGNAFKFLPATAAELFLKPHIITDAASDGYRFNFFYFSNYLKIHLNFYPWIFVSKTLMIYQQSPLWEKTRKDKYFLGNHQLVAK